MPERGQRAAGGDTYPSKDALAAATTDPYLRQTYEFGVLEDFDHLYRYANLYELLEGKQAEGVVEQLTEVMPGRPTIEEHRHPVDNLRRHYGRHTARNAATWTGPRTPRQSMVVTLATSRVAQVVGGVAEKLVGKVKEALD